MGFSELYDNYCSFKGRLNRKEYFLRGFKVAIAGSIFSAISAAVAGATGGLGVVNALFAAIASAWGFVSWFTSISLTARRFHDLNRTGWWQIFPNVLMFFWVISLIVMLMGVQVPAMLLLGFGAFALIGVILILFTCYMLFAKGTEGSNDYGPDPLAKEDAAEDMAKAEEAVKEAEEKPAEDEITAMAEEETEAAGSAMEEVKDTAEKASEEVSAEAEGEVEAARNIKAED